MPIRVWLALAPPPANGQSAPLWFQLVPFVLVFGIVYFLMIAPMRKKQKKHAEMLDRLRAGDRVVTSGGIYGTVVGVSDHVVQLRVADQVKIDVAKSAVAELQSTEAS